MTREEAKAEQDRIAEHFNLGWWYGTKCKPCCGVYPKIRTSDGFDARCWYECPVCGTRTEPFSMPWLAEEAWNRGELRPGQFSMF